MVVRHHKASFKREKPLAEQETSLSVPFFKPEAASIFSVYGSFSWFVCWLQAQGAPCCNTGRTQNRLLRKTSDFTEKLN